MPTAEIRYVRMVGDYILDVLPESARLRDLVLAYVNAKIGIARKGRQFVIAAGIALASCTMTIVATDLLEAETALVARIIQNEQGGLSLVIVQEAGGSPTVVLYREALTAERARLLMSDPQWASKALSDHAKRS